MSTTNMTRCIRAMAREGHVVTELDVRRLLNVACVMEYFIERDAQCADTVRELKRRLAVFEEKS